jgi:hypothetical protein
MPVSQLFEVTIDAAGVSTSKRVSKLSRKNCRRHLRASGVMESSLPLPVLPGPSSLPLPPVLQPQAVVFVDRPATLNTFDSPLNDVHQNNKS